MATSFSGRERTLGTRLPSWWAREEYSPLIIYILLTDFIRKNDFSSLATIQMADIHIKGYLNIHTLVL